MSAATHGALLLKAPCARGLRPSNGVGGLEMKKKPRKWFSDQFATVMRALLTVVITVSLALQPGVASAAAEGARAVANAIEATPAPLEAEQGTDMQNDESDSAQPSESPAPEPAVDQTGSAAEENTTGGGRLKIAIR